MCAVMPERGVMRRIGEYLGSGELFVHYRPQNPPVSPNAPGKTSLLWIAIHGDQRPAECHHMGILELSFLVESRDMVMAVTTSMRWSKTGVGGIGE
jgi:hypothetical protein